MEEKGWTKFVSTYPVVNKTWCYVFPIIGLSLGITRNDFPNLKAVFLFNEDYPEIEDVIHLVFRKTGDKRAELFREKLKSTDIFFKEYSPDDAHIIVILRIPTEYYREFDKFMDSKYSEFGENYKSGIIQFHGYSKGNKEKGTKVIETLTRDETLYRDWEEKIGEHIPRSQEANTRWDENLQSILKETFSEDLKIKSPQSEELQNLK